MTHLQSWTALSRTWVIYFQRRIACYVDSHRLSRGPWTCHNQFKFSVPTIINLGIWIFIFIFYNYDSIWIYDVYFMIIVFIIKKYLHKWKVPCIVYFVLGFFILFLKKGYEKKIKKQETHWHKQCLPSKIEIKGS